MWKLAEDDKQEPSLRLAEIQGNVEPQKPRRGFSEEDDGLFKTVSCQVSPTSFPTEKRWRNQH